MKNLISLAVPPQYITYLVAIRDAKRTPAAQIGTPQDYKNLLTLAATRIEGRFQAFTDAAITRQLESLNEWPSMHAIGDALRSCYQNDTKGTTNLKNAITTAQDVRVLKYCPLCGTTLVATFDHYLPASIFPEFSVHPLNLVPCCFTCNSTKGDEWLDEDGTRLFVYTYTDVIPAESFLEVELKTSTATTGIGAVFSIERPFGFNREAWSVIESHYERLNLIERYTNLSNDEIAEILADCKIYINAGGTNVRRFLRNKAVDRAAIHGASHWQAVLLRKFAAHRQLDRLIARVRN